MEGEAEAVAGGAGGEVFRVVEAPDVVEAEAAEDVVEADRGFEVGGAESRRGCFPSGPRDHAGIRRGVVAVREVAVESAERDDFAKFQLFD